MAASFAWLGEVEVDAALSWGVYRVVLVKHQLRRAGACAGGQLKQ